MTERLLNCYSTHVCLWTNQICFLQDWRAKPARAVQGNSLAVGAWVLGITLREPLCDSQALRPGTSWYRDWHQGQCVWRSLYNNCDLCCISGTTQWAIRKKLSRRNVDLFLKSLKLSLCLSAVFPVLSLKQRDKWPLKVPSSSDFANRFLFVAWRRLIINQGTFAMNSVVKAVSITL